MYSGAFNDLLGRLNNTSDWRELFGALNKNMRDRELILRFFALFFHGDNYQEPMGKFLNVYMRSNRDLRRQSDEQISKIFFGAVDAICSCVGKSAFRLGKSRALNAAIFDAVMVGIARRLQHGHITDCVKLAEVYGELIQTREFIDAVTASTTDKQNVVTRLHLATQAFAGIE